MASNHIYGIMMTIIMLNSMMTMGSDMKVKVIKTQALGRPFGLGMLYDYRSDSLLPGITLWSKDKLEKDLSRDETRSINTKFQASEKLSDKAELLNIEASLRLSFLGGSIDVSGSAKYLDDRKKYSNEQRVTLSYQCTTKYEQLNMGTLATENIDYPKIFENHLATHVVVAIQYGANVIFNFELLNYHSESSKDLQGEFEIVVKAIPSFNVEGDASGQLSDKQLEISNSLSIQFHGDIKPPYNPTTFQEAVRIYKNLSQLVGNHGEPLTVWLYPLEMLDSRAAKLAREISTSLILEVEEAFERFDKISMKCNDIENNAFFSKSTIFIDRVQLFQKLLLQETLIFQKSLIPVLYKVKGGFKEESILSDLLLNLTQSPFSYEKLDKYVSKCEYHVEQTTYLYTFLEGIEFLQAGSFHAHRLNPKYEHILGFIINIPVVDEQIIKDKFPSGIYNFSASDTVKSARLFKEFFDANKNKEIGTAFFMSELRTTEEDITGSIYLYTKGTLMSKKFMPPSPPEDLRFFDVKSNSVYLNWTASTPGTESELTYEISYQGFPNGDIKVIECPSNNLLLSSLEPSTNYTIKCRGVVPTGVTKYTESITVVTLPNGPDVTTDSSSMMATTNGNMAVATTITIGCPEGKYTCYKLPGCPPGFFRGPSTDQCFQRFANTTRTWDEAKAKCEGEGLVMAKPYDAISLRHYLAERFGDAHYWLGARGSDAKRRFIWTRNEQLISNSDTLWISGQPGSNTYHRYCLLMLAYASHRKSYPGQPFTISGCASKCTTLCELVMD